MMAAEKRTGITLGALFDDAVPARYQQLPVAGLALDSRKVSRGYVFIALPGMHGHGLEFAAQAADCGATAVLYEPDGADLKFLQLTPPSIAVPGLAGLIGEVAHRFHGRPSAQLRVAGITGTNGKTTVAFLLSQADVHCAYNGTLGYGLGHSLTVSQLTTPDVLTLHQRLAGFVDSGARRAAIEVSSHALQQQRVSAVQFDTAVFTNLTRDHLDYHGDMQSYFAAKRRLFLTPGLRRIVVNIDDDHGAALLGELTSGEVLRVASDRSLQPDLLIEATETTARGLRVSLAYQGQQELIDSPLIGAFNASNLALAAGVLLGWGWSLRDACQRLAGAAPVPGRMEAFGGGSQPLVVVDYAHTPDALENALLAARAHCAGQLWVVFGCGGQRDTGKRPLMGAIAARHADRVIVTDDNPRGEDPQHIIDAVISGAGDAGHVSAMRGRREAIHAVVNQAVAGDVVLLAGKGHEDYQLIGQQRIDLSDREEAQKLVGCAGE